MIRDVSTAASGLFQHGDKAAKTHVVNKTFLKGLVDDIQNLSRENVTAINVNHEDPYHLQELKFYEKYDPSVGYNTASVLGGMLLLILIYVIYKTSIKKHIINCCLHVKFKYILHKQESEGTLGIPEDKSDPMTYSFDTEKVPRAGELFDTTTKPESDKSGKKILTSGQVVSFDTSGTIQSYHEESNRAERHASFALDRHFSEDDARQLPVVVMDMKVATADWVRKQQKLFLNPGGFILKVKSDTICPPNNEIYPSQCTCTHIHPPCNPQHCPTNKRRQFSFCDRSHYSLDLNKSLPCFEIGEGAFKSVETGASSKKKPRHLLSTRFPSVSSEPKSPLARCGKCESFSMEPKSPNPNGNPTETHSSHVPSANTPVPSPKLIIDNHPIVSEASGGIRKNPSESNYLKLPHTHMQSSAPSSPQLKSPHTNLQPPSFHLQPLPPPHLTVSPAVNQPSVRTQSSQPLHITPIIKIQNMDKPRHQRKGSKESTCSSSEEDGPNVSFGIDNWPSPRTRRRGTLVRENAITCAPCNLCEDGPRLFLNRQISVDSGSQLRIPSPRPNPRLSRANSFQSNASIPSMETRL